MPLDESRLEYVGFWLRAWASLVDSVLAMFLVAPLAHLLGVGGSGGDSTALLSLARDVTNGTGSGDGVEQLLRLSEAMLASPATGSWGSSLLLNLVLPAVAIVAFWIARQATPGKMLIRAKIVDAATGAAPGRAQLVGRYLGYYVSMLGLFLGFAWVAFDPRKQGWHDKLAGTAVVRERNARA